MGLLGLVLMILDPFKIVRNYVFKPVATLGLAAAEEYRARKEKSVTTTKNVFLKLLVVVLVGFSVVWASIFLYLYFYYSYMPSVLHVKDVHLNIRYVPPPWRDGRMCAAHASPKQHERY